LSPLQNIRLAVLGLACFLTTVTVRAQTAAPAAGVKIGVINVQQAIAATAEGKQAAAELDTQFAPRQQELESLNKQINDISQRLNAGATLTDEDRQRLTVQGNRLAQHMERKKNEFQEDLNSAQLERVNLIGRKMITVIDRYATDGGYTAVFDSSSQNSPLLFAAKNTDVTQDIIRLYDQANPIKGASTAPATKTLPATKTVPAPKPSTPPPAKP
jgi:outer membrane protein